MMKNLFALLLAGGAATLVAILTYIIFYAFSGLIFWGIGSFIVWVFNISFHWTYLHGVATALIIGILKSIFKKQINIHTGR